MAAKIEPTERHLGGAAAGPDKLDERLRVSAEDLAYKSEACPFDVRSNPGVRHTMRSVSRDCLLDQD
jgi:hypothetical protein